MLPSVRHQTSSSAAARCSSGRVATSRLLAAGARQPADANLEELLPEGFVERTKEKGLVWPTKAPQKEILAHAAVGGFVTHGGWNSTLEALWFGVPMVPWPRYAEQHLNAHHVTHISGAGVRITAAGGVGAVVDRAEVERKVRRLMDAGDADGQKIRAKAAWAQKAVKSAVSDGGTSLVALLKLVEELQWSYCDVIAADDDQINRPRRTIRTPMICEK